MSKISTTKITSKGQIVIPEDIRDQLGIAKGDRFMVISNDDAIILKKLTSPPTSEIKGHLDALAKAAKAAGMTKADIDIAIQETRSKRK